jgi:hypothetical protein
MTAPIFIMAFANEQEQGHAYLRGISKEQKAIRKALEAAEGKGLVKPIYLYGASIADIFDAFQKEEYRGRIMGFHFSGHANSMQLLMEGENGGNQRASAKGLMPFLASQKSLRFVFLNACATQGQTHDLVMAGIPTIATSQSVNDEVATELSNRFYRGIGVSLPLKQAFADAQDHIRTYYGEGPVRDLYWEGATEAECQGEPWQMHTANAEALEWSLAAQQKLDQQGAQSTFKSQVRKAIAQNQLKEAFQLMQAEWQGKEQESAVTQLQGQLKKLESENRIGVISQENYHLRHAQIVHGMLSMLDEI